MADTKIRTRNATNLLREDHRTVKNLFAEIDKLDESDTAELARIFEEVKKEITVHSQIEEELFYPAIEMADDDKAEELVRDAREEHRLVMMLIEEISGLTADDPEFCTKMKVLMDTILRHIEEEESEIFPIFGGLEKAEQERIAEQLFARRNELSEEKE